MNNERPNIKQIIIEGTAREIYEEIQFDAKSCLEGLEQAEAQKEIEDSDREAIRKSVEMNLEEAAETSQQLNPIDNRIQEEIRKTVFSNRYKQFLTFAKSSDTLLSLVEFIVKTKAAKSSPAILASIKKIEPLAGESLHNRILMILSWDDILKEQRALMVFRMVHNAHRLTEIAILLQDHDAIQAVRNLLQFLDLDMPEEKVEFDIPENLDQLKQVLDEGVVGLLEVKKDIQQMDQQRKKLKSSQKQIANKLETLGSESAPSLPSTPQKMTPSTKRPLGMAFLSKKNR